MNKAILDICTPKPAVPALRRSERGAPLIQPDAVNVYVFLPCPLKVRFKTALESYMASYNPTAEWPLYCPNILDGGHEAIETELERAKDESQLPDVIVSVPMNILLSDPFKSRFQPLYQGLTKPEHLAAMPESYQRVTQEHNIGFLAFGYWSVIRDLSIAPDLPNPTSWADLTQEIYREQITMSGYQETVSGATLLKGLNESGGLEAVRALGRNVKLVRHFSQIIKGLDSADSDRLPFNVLANAASMQIPSRKNAVMLEFTDGPMFMPVLLYVKKSRLKESQGALDFFWSESFRDEVLAKGDFSTPDRVDWTRPYFFPDWNDLLTHDYRKLIGGLTSEFKKVSPAFAEPPRT